MKGKITIVIFLLVFNFCFSQEHAWVYFTDKPDGNTYLDNPLAMLSQKALNRRIKQNIILDLRDVPIAKSYIDAIINSAGILVKTKSKWLASFFRKFALVCRCRLQGSEDVARLSAR